MLSATLWPLLIVPEIGYTLYITASTSAALTDIKNDALMLTGFAVMVTPLIFGS